MADIELVIKIPEEIYKASQIIDVKYEDVIQIPLEVVAHGTPLPKGHGRLIDADEVNEAIYKSFENIQCYDGTGFDIYTDSKEIIDKIPTVKAIPKDQYENRLKADMVAMLSEVKDTVKHCEITGLWKANYQEGFNDGVAKSLDVIQQKIDKLKGE